MKNRWTATAAALLTVSCLAQAPVVRRSPQTGTKRDAPDREAQAPSGLGGEAADPADSAQDRAGIPTIRVQSRLVSVAVNAIDAQGQPVGSLEKDNFEVLEDGHLQPIAVFDREAETPLSVVMAIDTSETVLRDERLEREAAKQFVRALLRPQDEMALFQFADDVSELVAFTNSAQRVETGLGSLRRGDETALYDAVFLGARRLGETRTDAGRRRVLVLISDGGDTKDKATYRQAIEQAQRAGVMIYALIIVPIEADAGRNTAGEHALIQMADDTGGRYYYVGDPREMKGAFAKVSEDLRTQYVLGYYAPKGEAGFRRIQVRTKGVSTAMTLRYRTGYYAGGR